MIHPVPRDIILNKKKNLIYYIFCVISLLLLFLIAWKMEFCIIQKVLVLGVDQGALGHVFQTAW